MMWLDNLALALLLFLAKGWLILKLANFLIESQQVCSAILRHRCRALALAAIIFIPIAGVIFPNWVPSQLIIHVSEDQLQRLINTSGLAVQDGSGELLWWRLLPLIYVAMAIMLVLRLLVSHLAIALIAVFAKPFPVAIQRAHELDTSRCGSAADSRLKVSRWIDSPVVFGLIRPVILLPMDSIHWSCEKLALAVAHEKQHIRRGDWWWQSLAQFSLALLWPLPSAWQQLRHLQMEAEQSCDDGVVVECRDPVGYAELLLTTSVQSQRIATVGIAGSGLVDRVRRILDVSVDRSAWRGSALGLTLLWLLIAFPLGAISADIRALSPTEELREIPVALCHSCAIRRHPPGISPHAYRPAAPRPVVSPPASPVYSYPSIGSFITQRPSLQLPEVALVDVEANVSYHGVRALRAVMPRYPDVAMRNGVEGWVLAISHIRADGGVDAVRILQSHPEGVFDHAVALAFYRFLYEPSLSDRDGGGGYTTLTRVVFQRSPNGLPPLPIPFSGPTAVASLTVDYVIDDLPNKSVTRR